MNDLVKKLVEQLGLDDAVAEQAVGIILGMVKDKLPAPIAGQLENLLDGGDPEELMSQLGGGGGNNAGGIMSMLSGLLGGKK